MSQKQSEIANMKKQWTVEFHNDFAAEVRQLSQNGSGKVEGGGDYPQRGWSAARKTSGGYAQGLTPREHEGIAI